MTPDFIIIGASRAGTTSLYRYLSQHPQITMSKIKETNFFAYLASQTVEGNKITPSNGWVAKNFQEYLALFDNNKQSSVAGEATPFYLYAPGVPMQIKKHLPDVKLIAILRNPIDRAYSTYLKNRREGTESRDFVEAVQSEIQNPSDFVRSENFYIRTGLYFQHISRYLQYFDRSQIKIVFFEDLEKNTNALLNDIYSFINVSTNFQADTSVRFNEAIPPLIKNSGDRQQIKKFTSTIRKLFPQKIYFSLLNFKYKMSKKIATYPVLSSEMRILLRDQYVEDIKNLEKMIDRDLSHWLTTQ